jgi:2-dehydro-3-deoxyphosphogluconate aldolase/(4S)-4-hydroxy-2-oxoglutarate aldolase
MPGCFTPTEILDAWESGADIVKVFPSTALGPTFIKDVRAPLPQLKLMPTGGVSIENAADWLRAGAVAVGVGSALVDAAAVKAGDFAEITRRAEQLSTNIQAIRLKPDSTTCG